MARSNKRKQLARENTANRTSNAVARRPKIPRVISDGTVTTVKGSETIGQLGLGSAFAVAAVDLSPLSSGGSGIYGLVGTWLGRQATLYNRYRYVSCRLRYVPFVPTSTPGRVVLSYNSDNDDTIPTTITQVTQYQNAVEAPAWRDVSTSYLPTHQKEFVVTTGSGANAAGLPARPGVFVVGTDSGAGSSGSVGSLYLDYTVQFWSRAAFAVNS